MSPSTAADTPDVRDRILTVGQQIMGARGFSAVGLNEILTSAGVPKGSFYYYFASKEAFGEALLEDYFEDYLADMDATLRQPGLTMAGRLANYWRGWQENQSFLDCQGKCLVVKLGAEVSDLSEPMRASLKRGTSKIIEHLARAIEAGMAEGSLTCEGAPEDMAQSLYQLWLGTSLMAKIARSPEPFAQAMKTTKQMLHLPS